jgi:hypothetical protein
LGSTTVTGIQVSAYSRLKKALGIKGGTNRVYDPYQMLAEVEDTVKKAFGVDTYGIQLPVTIFGYKNEDWKRFRMFDGTDVEISGHFEYDTRPNGDIVQYPMGNRSLPPSARMPKDGFYFDTIVRQEPIDEANLDPKKWVEQTYSLYNEEQLRYLEETSQWWYENSDYSLLGNFWGAGFGDIAYVPGPGIPYPVGIRDPEEWYVSMLTRKGYVQDIFHYQFELQMKNLVLYKQAVGERIDVVAMCGTDFGSQNGPFISVDMYREMFKPLTKHLNDWVHANTNWKVFHHTCGSIAAYLDDFAEAGIDILNPVQISAADMSPSFLKQRYGDKFVFWGGAVDAQHTLMFGSPEQVSAEAKRNKDLFQVGGGFVFCNVHNIQATVPTENIVALLESARGGRSS